MSVIDRPAGSAVTPAARSASRRPRSSRPRLRPGFVLAQTSMYFVITLVAFTTFWPVYRSQRFVLLVVAGFVMAAAIALAGLFLRLASVWILGLLVVAFGIFGVALAVPNQALYGVLPSLTGLRELVAGVALSWKQLLTISLPVGSYQALLVPPLVLVLVGTAVGLSTTLRSARPELALVPPAVIYAAGIVFGPQLALLPVLSGLVLVALGIVWIVWWRLRRRRQAIDLLQRSASAGPSAAQRSGHRAVARRALAGTAMTLVVAAGASAVATHFIPPTTARWVARDAVDKPFDPRDYVSPLSGFRAYEQQPAADRPQVTVTGLAAGSFLRIATLDTYDGVAFSVGSDRVSTLSGTFTRVPTSVDQSAVSGRQSSLDITIDDYSGVWVPTSGQLETVDFTGQNAAALRDGFFYNDTTGTAAVLGGVTGGETYRLTTVEPTQPSSSALDSLTPGTASVPAPTDVPAELKTRLASYVDGVSGQGARLRAALAGLKSDGYVSHGVGDDEVVSRSGHGSDRLAQLFTDNIMIGDAEQYAAAAALMADELGFSARVVFGFAADDSGTPASSTTFTGSDITAQIEVDTAQYGWVRLDPNPAPRTIPDDEQVDPNQISRPQSVIQPPAQEADPPNNQSQPQSRQDNTVEPPAWIAILLTVARVGGWVALVAGLLAAPFIAVVAVKAKRRARRRTRGSPLARMTTGWDEYRDAVTDHGIATPASATRSEVARTVGSSRAGVLARVVDRAVFAPEPPSSDEADRVWKAVGEMRSHLDSGLTRRQRARAAVSLRSLRGYHGPRPSKR